jgi:hypothetical protein
VKIIRVEKCPSKTLGQQFSDGAFAGSSYTHENYDHREPASAKL